MRTRLDSGQEAREALLTMVAELGLELAELDVSTFPEELRKGFKAFYCKLKDGRAVVAVPHGQDPIERLGAVTGLIADQGREA